MGSELTIFSLYRNRGTEHFVLLRTVRPPFPNYSQTQDDLAYQAEQTRREALLNHVAATMGIGERAAFELIGELQDLPVGEELMKASGGVMITVFYLHTEYGYPWVILGTGSSEAGFLKELREDEDLLSLKPIGKPIVIEAKCFAESDAASPGRI
ncbi:hypothetical protein GCM10022409_20390 [Hymenobacter glaciei]|uniref:Uncharacterized protein n=1 Tax=Hymenobacter glaciei TaxID=877209 RepID=A0ABP7U3X4_9BACT